MIKGIFYKYNLLTILILSIIIMSACGDNDSTIASSKSVYNSSHIDEINSNSSEEDYIMLFIDVSNKYIDTRKYVINNVKDAEGIEDKTLDYLAYTKTLNISPVGEISNDIYESFNSFIISSELSVESYLKYAQTGESVHLKLGNDYGEDAVIDFKTVEKILNDYGY